RRVGPLEAPAAHPNLPPVIDAAHSRFLDAAEVERREPMRAELAHEPGPAVLGAKRDEALAEQLHPLDPSAGRDFVRKHDRDPVLAQEPAHRRTRAGPRQELVLFTAQHRLSPLVMTPP